MKPIVLLVCFAAMLLGAGADAGYVIDTVAGSDLVGDGGMATGAQLSISNGLAVDRSGNIYVGDTDYHRIRKITPAGLITTIAGNGYPGYRGDDTLAADSQIAFPYGVAVDAAGNVYFADFGNHRVRRIGTDGRITTIAGNGQKGSSGDGGAATSAQLMAPRNVALDAAGNVYISEFEGHRIRKVSPDGVITTVAGTGVAGLNTAPRAIDAQLNAPAGLAVDRTGAIYAADSGNQSVRKIFNGNINTVVMLPSGSGSPIGLVLDAAGSLYVVTGSPAVYRVVLPDLKIVAGTGDSGFDGDGRPAIAAKLAGARDIAFDSYGALYIADGRRIRKVATTGMISTIAGDGFLRNIGDKGAASGAILSFPSGVALGAAGAIYVADSGTARVRRIDATGVISTITGNGRTASEGDGGPAAAAVFNEPAGLGLDSAGDLFVADATAGRVRKILPVGLIRTIVGSGVTGLGADGDTGTATSLVNPRAVAIDAAGFLYIADTSHHRVLRTSGDGTVVNTVAGNGTSGFAGDGGRAALAQLYGPSGLAVDSTGNLYIADTYNHRIRRVSPAGLIATVAGSTAFGFSGDGGPATAARLYYPAGVALDQDGNLYIADSWNHRIRKVTVDGTIHTIAGGDLPGFSGDGGPALAAQLNYPTALAVNSSGVVYVADRFNNRIRKLTPMADAPVVPDPVIDAVVLNAASLTTGPVAPGEIVSIFGAGIGPPIGAQGRANSSGLVDTIAGDTEVLFDGVPAAIFYAQDTQVNAQVPYTVSGKTSVQLDLRYKGVTKQRAAIAVVPSAPAIFTVAGGTGQVLAVNADGSLNSESNPASRDSVMTLFATGDGQTDPPGVAGKVAQAPYAKPVLPVSLAIGRAPAEILFLGAAPGLTGMLQINARVPGGFVPPGVLPVVLTVGEVNSQAGVTIAVK